MMVSSHIHPDIESFCKKLSTGLAPLADVNACVGFCRREMPALLRRSELFTKILQDFLEGAKYPDARQATMFDNELLLYPDPNRQFSLRMFLWDPGEYTQVHDHGSWGVIGPVTGELEVINYTREDDGSDPSFARLSESERLRLRPGETAHTFPLNEGIHKIGNPTDTTMLSLSLYGNPLPRGYVNEFDIEAGRVRMLLAPKTKKQVLAIRALPQLNPETGRKIREKFGNHRLEIFRFVGRSVSPD